MAQEPVDRSPLRKHFEALVELDPSEWTERVRLLAIPHELQDRLLVTLLLDRIRWIPEAQWLDWLAALALDAGIAGRVRRSIPRACLLDRDARDLLRVLGPVL